MSDYEDEQSEDGELALSAEDDDNDEDDDSNSSSLDSCDLDGEPPDAPAIKPPQPRRANEPPPPPPPPSRDDRKRERERERDRERRERRERARDKDEKRVYRDYREYRDREYRPPRPKEPYRDHSSSYGKRSAAKRPDKPPSRRHSDSKENRDRPDRQSGDKELEDLRSRLLSKRQSKEQQQASRKRDFSPDGRDHHRRDKAHKIDRNMLLKRRDERIDTSPESKVCPRLPELDKTQLERREKLLKTEREMSHRKKTSREALAERREKLKQIAAKRNLSSPPIHKKRHRHSQLPSPQTPSDVVTVSDASDVDMKEDGSGRSNNNTEEGEGSGSSSESSSESSGEESDTEEEDEKNAEAHKNNNKEKTDVEGRITEPPTPQNIDSSPQSTRSATPKHRSRSRSHSFSPPPVTEENGTAPDPTPEEPVKSPPPASPEEKRPDLPPYFPGIQGCRFVEEFQCLNRIEEGTYGIVYRARDKTTDEIVALKRLKMEKEKEGFPITSLREINTLLKGQHPNIVTVREIVVGSNMDKIFIVMDYVEHDLKGLMETMRARKQIFIPGEVKCLMQQLLRAVDHLHDNWILHRDLKTSNLLLSHKGILKVGDFGLAREYGSPLKQYTPIVVTLWYRAPELLLGAKQYSTHIDIWSVGCIFAEFITMNALFPGKSEVDQLNKIFKELGTPNETIWPDWSSLSGARATWAVQPGAGLRNRVGSQLSEVGLELLQGLLTYDPKKRYTAQQALCHNYFKEQPMAIDPAMFPTWPAKSEGGRRHQDSPKPPSGGDQYKMMRDEDQAAVGFHMGKPAPVTGPFLPPVSTGFKLKF